MSAVTHSTPLQNLPREVHFKILSYLEDGAAPSRLVSNKMKCRFDTYVAQTLPSKIQATANLLFKIGSTTFVRQTPLPNIQRRVTLANLIPDYIDFSAYTGADLDEALYFGIMLATIEQIQPAERTEEDSLLYEMWTPELKYALHCIVVEIIRRDTVSSVRCIAAQEFPLNSFTLTPFIIEQNGLYRDFLLCALSLRECEDTRQKEHVAFSHIRNPAMQQYTAYVQETFLNTPDSTMRIPYRDFIPEGGPQSTPHEDQGTWVLPALPEDPGEGVWQA